MEQFIKSIENTPYVWWREGDEVGKKQPFWAENSVIPSIEEIKEKGCNCAGFINLICRFLQTPIPGIPSQRGLTTDCLWLKDQEGGLKDQEEWAGGSWYWFEYLKNTNKLEIFDPNIEYPEGTLLLRPYTSPDDQGHLAIILTKNRIAHSFPEKGIQIEPSILISHNWIKGGYYTHVCKPDMWQQAL